jgi:DNA-binding transcriptional LysR family regulator
VDVDHLNVFLSVVRLGSFAAVAKVKNRDPSWVSRVIAGLESELDITLFKRSNRMLILTEAGERYAARVAEALEKLDHAHDEAKAISREISGRLVITASTAFGHAVVVPIVLAFKRQHPEIILDLRFCDHTMELKVPVQDLAAPQPLKYCVA